MCEFEIIPYYNYNNNLLFWRFSLISYHFVLARVLKLINYIGNKFKLKWYLLYLFTGIIYCLNNNNGVSKFKNGSIYYANVFFLGFYKHVIVSFSSLFCTTTKAPFKLVLNVMPMQRMLNLCSPSCQ